MKPAAIVLACLTLISAGCQAVNPYSPIKVEGVAMAPTLTDGDRVLIEKNPEKLERGDIVVFLFPADQTKSYIKRIIGLPNDAIEIREGKVFVNGTPLDEPYLDPNLNLSHRSSQEVKLSADSYYVIGDNRDNSSDSRLWGPLNRKLIYGRYVKKYYDAGP